MRRDIGNEVIVAIAVVGVLAFAITFAVILSLSGGTGTDATETATAILDENTAIPSVAQPSSTLIDLPSATASETEPSDRVEITSTNTLTLTRTPRPTEPEPTATLTPREPTRTLVPSRTPGRTPTRKPTLTSTPVLKATVTLTPSPSPTAIPTASATSLPETQPFTPFIPTFSPESGVEGCTDPGVQITSLYPGQPFSGVFAVAGTATASDFASYKIEIRPEVMQVFNFHSRSDKPVINGLLASVDARLFAPGRYWIRLSVLTQSDVSPTSCSIPVIFQ